MTSKTKLALFLKRPLVLAIIVLAPLAYFLRFYLMVLFFLFFVGPFAAHTNYYKYDYNDAFYTLYFILPAAMISFLLGIVFRSSWKGKILMVIGIATWFLYSLCEVGRWC